ncbi:MAG: SBBP repeat-containing protein [Kiritimatiellae bacterium]|nr:SBBP repeat-containing protein [Kiritimatiellia bacterium]
MLFACVSSLPAEPQREWTRLYGSDAGDYAQGAAVDGTSAVYVAGYTYGQFDGQINIGPPDLCLSRFDGDGTRGWSRIWGSTESDYAYGVGVDGTGRVYVAGNTYGAFGGETNAGGRDICLRKFDADGATVWTRIRGSSANDDARGVAVAGDGSVYAAGYTAGAFDGQTNAGSIDLCLLKFDEAGTLQWTRLWGSSAGDYGSGVCVDETQGDTYVAGYTFAGFDAQTNNGGADLCLTRHDAAGNRLWTRVWGSDQGDYANAAACDGAAVYVAGETEGAFGGQVHSGGTDICLSKFDIDGNLLWSRIWGSPSNETARAVCLGTGGRVYVTGFTVGTFDGQSNTGQVDMVMSCLDGDGNRLWTRIWGSEADDAGAAACISPAHQLFVAGYAQGAFDAQSHAGGADLCLCRWTDAHLDIRNLPAADVTNTSASLRGELLDNAGEDPAVTVYWGPDDGATTPAAWSNAASMGLLGTGPFTTNVTGLASNTVYSYRCWASNSTDTAWAPETATFRTGPDTDADGMDDGLEITWFGDLSHDAADESDGDGLTDLAEFQNATDPTDVDTDDDEYDDYAEVRLGTDPTLAESAPPGPDRAWSRVWGSASGDYLRSVQIRDNGTAYAAGYTYGAFAGETNAGGADVCVAKFDGSGEHRWSRIVGSDQNEFAQALAVAESGSVYVGGSTAGAWGGQTNAGLEDIFLVKYGAAGALHWTRIWGSAQADYGSAVLADSAGDFWVAGHTAGDMGTAPNAGGLDFCLNHLDADGALLQVVQWGSAASDYAAAVAADATGHLVVAGYTYGELGGQTNAGGADLCLCRLTRAGELVWARIWGSATGDFGAGAAADQSGNVYAAGSTDGAFDGQTNAGGSDLCLSKFDSAGNRLWTRIWGTASNETAGTLCIDDSDALFLTGFTLSAIDGQTHSGAADIFVTRLDTDGNRLWTRMVGSAAHDLARAACVDAYHRLCVASDTEGAFDGQQNSGGSDLCLVAWRHRYLDVRNLDPAAITEDSAILNGTLVDTGLTNTATVRVCWGETDGGATPSAWTNTYTIEAVGQGGFTTNLTGLSSNTVYYYRCWASNQAESAWAPVSEWFRTGPDTDADGMDDAWETTWFASLARDGTGDLDNDAVSDLDEFLHDADPTRPDSDGDGYDDYMEILAGTAPGDDTSFPSGLSRAWSRIWGSAAGEYGRAAAVAHTGAVYTAGYAYGAVDGATNAGSADLCLSRLDMSGNRLWTRLAGSAEGDYAYALAVDEADNAYMAGYTDGDWAAQTNAGGADLCLSKVDPAGNTVWTRIWGSADDEYGRAVTVDPAGDIVAAGHTAGAFGGEPNAGQNDICISKFDRDGNPLWTRIFGSAGNDYGWAVCSDTASNLYVAGYTDGAFGGETNAGGFDLVCCKLAADGTSEWTRIWGSAQNDYATGIAVDTAGNVYVAGYAEGSFDGQTNAGLADLCLTRFDAAGTRQWTRLWGSADEDNSGGIVVMATGIYVSGYAAGTVDGEPHSGEADMLLSKWDQDGNRLWTRLWGSASNELARALAADDVHGLYVAGYSDGSLDGQANSGGFDLCLSRWVEHFLEVANLPPSDVTLSSASLNGRVVDTGDAEDPLVALFWGLSDGQTEPAGWSNEVPMGQLGVGAFSTNITGLSSNTVYYYRCRASNSADVVWAPASTAFYTGADTDFDGMNDAWETAWFGDLSRDGTGDLDGDGLTDLAEFQNGAAPTLWDTDGDRYDDFAEVAGAGSPGDGGVWPPAPGKAWTRIWGSAANDFAWATQTDGTGSVYAVGYTYGDLDGQTNAGDADLCISRFDLSGNPIGSRLWGSPDADYAYGMARDAAGALYVGGVTRGAFGGQAALGGTDLFLTQLDAAGNPVWSRILGSVSNDYGRGLATDSAGRVYLAGYTAAPFDGQPHAGAIDACLISTDSAGTSRWTRIWGSAQGDYASAACAHGSNAVYAAGYTYGEFGGQTNSGGADLYLSKFDEAGTLSWSRVWGSADGDYAEGVAADSAGNVYVAGYSEGAFDGASNAGLSDACLTKFDSDGNRLWTRIWGTNTDEFATDIVIDAHDNVYVGGYTLGALDGQTNAGLSDLFVSKFDTAGNRLWTCLAGSETNDVARGLCVDAYHGIYSAGWTDGSFDSRPNSGASDLCLVRWGDRFLEIRNAPASNVETNAAMLGGEVVDTGGGVQADVCVYWGLTDGGDSAAAWSNTLPMGLLDGGPFETNLTGLAANTRYYYRCLASNATAVAWAPATDTFHTGPDADGDGMADAWEQIWFGTLTRDGTGDFDGDGLTDAQEHDNGTEPTAQDTDTDDYDDYAEVAYGSAPDDAGSIPAVLSRAYTRLWGAGAGDHGRGLALSSTAAYWAGYSLGAFDGQTNAGGADFCIGQLDGMGNRVWTRIWGSASHDYLQALRIDASNALYVAGYSGGEPDGLTNAGNNDLYLGRFDEAGNRTWSRLWGSAADDYGQSVAPAAGGALYVCGHTLGAFGGQTNAGNADLCLTRFDADGTPEWSRIWGSAAGDYGRGVAVDTQGNVFVGGYTYGAFDGQTHAGNADFCLSRFDAAGTRLWTRIWGSAAADDGGCLAIDRDGSVYVAGSTEGAFDGETNAGGTDLCLSKFDGGGNRLWTRIWGSPSNDVARAVCVEERGDILVAGFAAGAFDGEPVAGSADFVLCRFDGDGNRLRTRIWGSTADDVGYALCTDREHGIHVIGYADAALAGQPHAGGSDICVTRWKDRYLDVLNLSPADVTQTSASLRGELIDTGAAANPEIVVYWGPSDGGTDPTAWSNAFALGTLEPGVFSTNLTSLSSERAYAYRCWASNSAGTVWAIASTPFRTGDADLDGISDTWEIAWFGNTTRTGDADFDGDTFTDREEFIANTAPTDESDWLQIQDAFAATGATTALVMVWDSETDREYTVLSTTNLQAAWTTVFQSDGNGSEQRYTNSLTGDPERFFRLDVKVK